jgi:hypothetical protein
MDQLHITESTQPGHDGGPASQHLPGRGHANAARHHHGYGGIVQAFGKPGTGPTQANFSVWALPQRQSPVNEFIGIVGKAPAQSNELDQRNMPAGGAGRFPLGQPLPSTASATEVLFRGFAGTTGCLTSHARSSQTYRLSVPKRPAGHYPDGRSWDLNDVSTPTSLISWRIAQPARTLSTLRRRQRMTQGHRGSLTLRCKRSHLLLHTGLSGAPNTQPWPGMCVRRPRMPELPMPS